MSIEITIRNWNLMLQARSGKGYTWLWGAGKLGNEVYLDLGPMFLSATLFNLDHDTDEDTDRTVH